MTNDSKFQLRLADDELAMLRALAAEKRTSAAHVVRELVRREHAEAFGGSKQTKRKATR